MAASAASALLPAAQRIARQWRPPDAVLEVEVRAELPLQGRAGVAAALSAEISDAIVLLRLVKKVNGQTRKCRFVYRYAGGFVATSSPENTCLLARATGR